MPEVCWPHTDRRGLCISPPLIFIAHDSGLMLFLKKQVGRFPHKFITAVFTGGAKDCVIIATHQQMSKNMCSVVVQAISIQLAYIGWHGKAGKSWFISIADQTHVSCFKSQG